MLDLLEPITAEIRTITYLNCNSEECHLPRGRSVAGDPTKELMLECQSPTTPLAVNQIIGNYFTEGYRTIGKYSNILQYYLKYYAKLMMF